MVPAAAPPAQPPSRLARFRRGSQAPPAKVLVTAVDGSLVGAPLAKAPGICQGPPQAWLGTELSHKADVSHSDPSTKADHSWERTTACGPMGHTAGRIKGYIRFLVE